MVVQVRVQLLQLLQLGGVQLLAETVSHSIGRGDRGRRRRRRCRVAPAVAELLRRLNGYQARVVLGMLLRWQWLLLLLLLNGKAEVARVTDQELRLLLVLLSPPLLRRRVIGCRVAPAHRGRRGRRQPPPGVGHAVADELPLPAGGVLLMVRRVVVPWDAGDERRWTFGRLSAQRERIE